MDILHCDPSKKRISFAMRTCAALKPTMRQVWHGSRRCGSAGRLPQMLPQIFRRLKKASQSEKLGAQRVFALAALTALRISSSTSCAFSHRSISLTECLTEASASSLRIVEIQASTASSSASIFCDFFGGIPGLRRERLDLGGDHRKAAAEESLRRSTLGRLVSWAARTTNIPKTPVNL